MQIKLQNQYPIFLYLYRSNASYLLGARGRQKRGWGR